MRETKLILVEGIPGSGKSTLSQFLADRLADSGRPVSWWYEEQKGHPVYMFDGEASLDAVLDDLRSGRFDKLVDAALAKWRQFVEEVNRGDKVVILDSCLFGYLTWSLFPFDAPTELIERYVAEVARIIAPTKPCLVYLYQDDVPRTLGRVGEARGQAWADSFVVWMEECPYGRRNGLTGFTGLVSYWTDYQNLTNSFYESLPCAKVKIEGSAGEWLSYQEQLRQFFELTSVAPASRTAGDLRRFVGSYATDLAGTCRKCEISLLDGELVASGLPELWPSNRLIPIGQMTFRVASFPCEVTFVADEAGAVYELRVAGEELLSGGVGMVFTRQST